MERITENNFSTEKRNCVNQKATGKYWHSEDKNNDMRSDII